MNAPEIWMLLGGSLCMAWAAFAAWLLRTWLRQIVSRLVRVGEAVEELAERVSALEREQRVTGVESVERRDARRAALLRSLLTLGEPQAATPEGDAAWPA